jgi:hypothetical protein
MTARLRHARDVNPETITYVLTALAAVVVVLTRVRLGANDHEGAGRVSIPHSLLNTHTGAGVLGVLIWVGFLVTEKKIVAYAGLAFLWVTVVAGLLVLLRWMPAHGRHSSGPVADSWGEGPGLSILAHIGMLVAVGLFTAFVVLDKIPR